jgi:hypothetical protein
MSFINNLTVPLKIQVKKIASCVGKNAYETQNSAMFYLLERFYPEIYENIKGKWLHHRRSNAPADIRTPMEKLRECRIKIKSAEKYKSVIADISSENLISNAYKLAKKFNINSEDVKSVLRMDRGVKLEDTTVEKLRKSLGESDTLEQHYRFCHKREMDGIHFEFSGELDCIVKHADGKWNIKEIKNRSSPKSHNSPPEQDLFQLACYITFISKQKNQQMSGSLVSQFNGQISSREMTYEEAKERTDRLMLGIIPFAHKFNYVLNNPSSIEALNIFYEQFDNVCGYIQHIEIPSVPSENNRCKLDIPDDCKIGDALIFDVEWLKNQFVYQLSWINTATKTQTILNILDKDQPYHVSEYKQDMKEFIKLGISPEGAYRLFLEEAKQVKYVISHNAWNDMNYIFKNMIAYGIDWWQFKSTIVCTYNNYFVKRAFRARRLNEIYEKLYGNVYVHQHTADKDTYILYKCVQGLLARGAQLDKMKCNPPIENRDDERDYKYKIYLYIRNINIPLWAKAKSSYKPVKYHISRTRNKRPKTSKYLTRRVKQVIGDE